MPVHTDAFMLILHLFSGRKIILYFFLKIQICSKDTGLCLTFAKLGELNVLRHSETVCTTNMKLGRKWDLCMPGNSA